MTDRPVTVPVRWWLVPLAGLVLALLPWLLVHSRRPEPSGDGPAITADCTERLPAPTLPFHPPQLLPASLSDPASFARATGYTADSGNLAAREEPAGPMLIGPSPVTTGSEIGGSRAGEFSAEPLRNPSIEAQPPLDLAAPSLPLPSLVSPPPTPPGDGLRTVPPPEGSPLPARDARSARSEQLESIARQADQKTRHGFELAGRGAYFAARSEFLTALRLVAQGLDAEAERPLHSRALAAGLTAMKEAEDFIPGGSRLEADLDVPAIIGSHRTPVLKGGDAEALTPLAALRCYFTFAQEQLAAAAGHEVAGSMALHALGKLYGTLAQQRAVRLRAAEPKTVACYQAALLVCPQNSLAANDLGVLLAQHGYPAEARRLLEHSLEISRQSTGWRNLAVVYQQLGQGELARRAHALADAARRAEAGRSGRPQPPSQQLVRWTDPTTFAQTAAEIPPGPTAPADAKAAPQNSAPPGKPSMAARQSGKY